MKYEKKYSFGLGTILSLIIVYFIYLYARDKGWTILAFIAKWYLIISLAFVGLFVLIIVLVLLVFLLILLFSFLSGRSFKRRRKKRKDYIDAEYRVEE